MPGIVISGYYGFGNAGDEAILAGLVSGLRLRLGDYPLTVLSINPPATAQRYRVQVVPRQSVPAVAAALRQSRLLLSGGGGLFQDATGWQTPAYYGGVIALARMLCRPALALGQGIGPLRSHLGRSCCRFALRRCALVDVRDEESVALLRSLGVQAELGADLAYLLPLPTPEQVAAAWEQVGGRPQGPLVGVSLRPLPGQADAGRVVGPVSEALNRFCAAGARPVLIPFQLDRDLPVLEQLAAALEAPALLLRAELAPRELFALLGGLRGMVGMRLHSLLLAARWGMVPVGISYDPKVDAYLARLGLAPATTAARPQAPDLLAALERAAAPDPALRSRLALANEAMAALAACSLDRVCELCPPTATG